MILLQKRYGHLARVLHWCTDQAITRSLEEMDLTSSQGHIMGFLSHQKTPPCPRDIEVAFQLSHPTVSGLLSRLEKKGFVELRTDPKDRRCKRIYVLPRGSECHDRMHRIIEGIESRLVTGFSETEQAQFEEFLNLSLIHISEPTRLGMISYAVF